MMVFATEMIGFSERSAFYHPHKNKGGSPMPESAYTMIFAVEALLVFGAIGTGVVVFLTNRNHRADQKVAARRE